jgi:hypothetical protein
VGAEADPRCVRAAMPAMTQLSYLLMIPGRTSLQLTSIVRHAHCIRTPHPTHLMKAWEQKLQSSFMQHPRIYTSKYLQFDADADACS